MGKLSNLIKKLKPIGKENSQGLESIKRFVDNKTRLNLIKSLLKEEKINIFTEELDSTLAEKVSYPQIKAKTENVKVEKVNKEIKEKAIKQLFSNFSANAFEKISNLIAPNISGMDSIKKAVAIQLFCKQ